MQPTTSLSAPEQVTLYYREGASDKVYQAKLEPKGEGFAVTFAFGRRGSALQTGTKTTEPVGYERALAIYRKLVNEKKAKGYTQGEAGTPYLHTEKQNQVSGLLPQLLNPIEESEAECFQRDPRYALQEKIDGRRLLLRKRGHQVEGINRKGLIVGLSSLIMAHALLCPEDFILDGECVGDTLYAFDLLELGDQDYRPLTYHERYMALEKLLPPAGQRAIEVLPTGYATTTKVDMYRKLKESRAEGVVFKQLDAPYTPGRPNQGGPQLKCKFYATGSFLVAGINAQRSVSLRLIDRTTPCGNVTIPANQPVPPVGTVIEVRYLYVHAQDGSLIQPVYLGERHDLDPSACVTAQLKCRGSSEEDES